MKTDTDDNENNKQPDPAEEARDLLTKEDPDLKRAAVIAKILKGQNKFAYAAELYLLLLDGDISKKEQDEYLEELAHCLYKDPDLPSSVKFNFAAGYLEKREDLSNTRNSEVLGKLGAIFKYKWQYDNLYRNLLYSRHYYERGYTNWHDEFVVIKKRDGTEEKRHYKKLEEEEEKTNENDHDAGYTAINYAYLLDLMANVRLDITSTLPKNESESADRKLKEARRIREEILYYFKANKHKGKDTRPTGEIDQLWIYPTIGEAFFGLGAFDEAKKYYKWYVSGEKKPDMWQIESTAKQLTALAQVQIQLLPFALKQENETIQSRSEKINTAACECLAILYEIEKQKELPDIARRGKVGLALSGGGFRAALFHIGMLARLAELNVLRHVEVLSCVSGGSILGAYYYLLLKKKMDAKGDDELSREHYIRIVEQLVKQFRLGVQKNIRVRVLSSIWKNLSIFFSKDYTRTHRVGELYEENLYHELLENTHKKGAPIYINELKINPEGRTDFNIKVENWNRRNKVPMLVLNATSLNTGHNWQFTASWMGEPPGNIQKQVDSKPRLRRMYYTEAPLQYRNFRLGHAVGASSCVPALFEPLLLRGLYPNIDLMLVDGGVQDNQGTSSLLEQECKVLIVSDASGQLPNEATLGTGPLNAFFRSDMVLQEKVREHQLMDLTKRKETSQITGLFYLHLKKDLHNNPVKWIGCKEPTRKIWLKQGYSDNITKTSYGILKNVQEHLAGLRTDLDAFSDAEAYALMYSGYCQAEVMSRSSDFTTLFKKDMDENSGIKEQWEFLHIAPWMTEPEQSESLVNRLKVGRMIPLKVFQTSWLLRLVATIPILMVLGLIAWLLCRYWPYTFTFKVEVQGLAMALGIYLIDVFVGTAAAKVVNFKSTILKALFFALGAVILAWFHKFYLYFLNRLFLEWGKLVNLEREDKLKKWAKKAWEFIS